MNRVNVQPSLLRWARERSGRSVHDLQRRFPKLDSWEQGEVRPTLKQLEAFARTTYTPIGFMFLTEPPVEELPVTDFRTTSGVSVSRPSADLLDTLYLCQQRQEWYRTKRAALARRLYSLLAAWMRRRNLCRLRRAYGRRYGST